MNEPTLFVHLFAHSCHSSFSLLPCLQIPHNNMSNTKNLTLFLVGNRKNIDENSYKSLYNCYYYKSDMPKITTSFNCNFQAQNARMSYHIKRISNMSMTLVCFSFLYMLHLAQASTTSKEHNEFASKQTSLT